MFFIKFSIFLTIHMNEHRKEIIPNFNGNHVCIRFKKFIIVFMESVLR